MLREGRGIGVRDGAGRWVGSALALPLGERLSWISMVLVAKHARRRRHRHAPAAPRDRRACATTGRIAGLDATELGRPVYLPLGFRDLYTISRLRLDAPAPAASTPAGCTIRPLVAGGSARASLPSTLRAAGCSARMCSRYLLQQAAEAAFVADVEGGIAGFVLGRPGRMRIPDRAGGGGREDDRDGPASATRSRVSTAPR